MAFGNLKVNRNLKGVFPCSPKVAKSLRSVTYLSRCVYYDSERAMRDGQKDLNSGIEQCGPWSWNWSICSHSLQSPEKKKEKKRKNFNFFGIMSTICNLFGGHLEK